MKTLLFKLALLIAMFSSCMSKKGYYLANIEINANTPVKIYSYNLDSNKFIPLNDTVHLSVNKFALNKYEHFRKTAEKPKEIEEFTKGKQFTFYKKHWKKSELYSKTELSGFDEKYQSNLKDEFILQLLPSDANYDTMIYKVNWLYDKKIKNKSRVLNLIGGVILLSAPFQGVDNFNKVHWMLPKKLTLTLPLSKFYYETKKIRIKDSLEMVRRDSLLAIAKNNKIKIKGDGILFLGTKSKNGYAHGTGNAISTNRNIIYEDAEFLNGILTKGKFITFTNEIYEGQFKSNLPHGKGILINALKTQFTGNFVNGTLEGDAEIKWQNGAIYTGKMKANEMSGKGKLLFADGGYYDGEFLNGKFDGKGEMVKGNEKFIGSFKNGSPHGEGVYFDNNVPEKSEFFEGQRIDQAYQLEKENKRAELARQLELKEEKERQDSIAYAMAQWEQNQKGNKFLKGVLIVGGVLIGASLINDMSQGYAAGTTLNNTANALKGTTIPSGQNSSGGNRTSADNCGSDPRAMEFLNRVNQGTGCQTCALCANLVVNKCLLDNGQITQVQYDVMANDLKEYEKLAGGSPTCPDLSNYKKK